MTITRRADGLTWCDLDNSKSHVRQTPGVCGGDACIRNTRYTVWGLVEERQLGLSDESILRAHPDLAPEDLQAAWAYYGWYKEEIDRAIRENGEVAR